MTFNFQLFSDIAKTAYRLNANHTARHFAGMDNPYYSFNDVLSVFWCYFNTFEQYMGYAHPPINTRQIEHIINVMPWIFQGNYMSYASDLTADDYVDMIAQHFNTRYRNCDYNINHFFSGKIREYRFREVCA